jgi:hypothetical protein
VARQRLAGAAKGVTGRKFFLPGVIFKNKLKKG